MYVLLYIYSNLGLFIRMFFYKDSYKSSYIEFLFIFLFVFLFIFLISNDTTYERLNQLKNPKILENYS